MEQNQNTNAALQVAILGQPVAAMQEKFAAAVATARNIELQDNACASFQAVCVIAQLREALTDEVMQRVFMPLMNTSIGFRTDHDPNRPRKKYNPSTRREEVVKVEPYSVDVVRDCLVDAICIGLMPTGNQFNIIAERMYPTKEGYTALLKKIGCKYYINVGQDTKPADAPFAEIPCRITYEHKGDKNALSIVATVKKDSYSSADQLRGKAERRAKKSLFEFLTGCDFGDADEDSAMVENKPVLAVQDVNFEPSANAPEPQAAAPADGTGWRKRAAGEAKQECPI